MNKDDIALVELDCGIRLVMERIPHVHSLAVGMWVNVGSRDEAIREEGITHFIEHTVFKGTKRRKMHQVARHMEAVGGYLNAFTGKEYTCYYAGALDRDAQRAADILTDITLNATFPPNEVEKEKQVVLEEIKMYEDQPEDHVFDFFEESIYGNHALGRPVIGYASSIASFERNTLSKFVTKHYTGPNLVIAAAGNLDFDKFQKQVSQCLGRFDVSKAQQREVRSNGVEMTLGRRVEIRKPVQQAHIVYGRQIFGMRDHRRAALTVLNTVLGGGMSSRLNQRIREKYGYCYTIYSFANLHSDAGDFGVYTATDPERVDRMLKLIQREMSALCDAPISNRVLAEAKAQARGAMVMGLESTSNRMNRIGRQTLQYGSPRDIDETLAMLEAVRPSDVQDLAQALFEPDYFHAINLIPQV